MLDDRGDEREQIKQREKDRCRQELEDLRSILKTPGGRRFVWRLLEDAGVLKDAFTGNSNTYYILGKQAFGKFLLADILQRFIKEYAKMQAEAETRLRLEKKEGTENV